MKNATQKSGSLTLNVTLRTAVGKQVKKLRKSGTLPANIYGADFKSTSISVPYSDFAKAYKQVRATGIVYLSLDSQNIPTMIKHIQRHPLDSTVMHVDFRKVDLSKKVVAEVPVKTIGISEAVSQKGGVLLTQASTLSVEALPQDVPQVLEVDISILKEIGTDIKVKDLVKSDKYTVTADFEKVIVSVTAHKEESIIAETTAAAAPEVLTAKVAEEGEEGAEGAKTAAPVADKKTDDGTKDTKKDVKKDVKSAK